MSQSYQPPSESYSPGTEVPGAEFYKHTGAVPLPGLVMTLLVGSGVAALLGVIYSFGICKIPYIYVCFLLTGGFGVGLGFAVGWMAKLGHLRNSFVTGLLGLICGAVGLYVAWAFDPYARYSDVIPPGEILFAPADLFAYMGAFYEEGAWGFTNNSNVSGIFLGILWALEAVVICGCSAFFAASVITGRVYCETCRKWITTRSDAYRLAAEGVGDAMQKGLLEDVRHLPALPRAKSDDQAYVQLDLTSCPGCEYSHYLSAKAVTHVPNKEGKLEKKEQPMMGHRVIPREDVQLIQQLAATPAPASAPIATGSKVVPPNPPKLGSGQLPPQN